MNQSAKPPHLATRGWGNVVQTMHQQTVQVYAKKTKTYVLLSANKHRGLFTHYTAELAGATNSLIDLLYASVPLPLGWGPATKGSLINSVVANSIKNCASNIFIKNSHLQYEYFHAQFTFSSA